MGGEYVDFISAPWTMLELKHNDRERPETQWSKDMHASSPSNVFRHGTHNCEDILTLKHKKCDRPVLLKLSLYSLFIG